jgi:hypothetical protein
MPLLLPLSKPVQISGLGTGTQLSYAQTLQTADLEKYIQTGALLGHWNKCYRTELPYYFSWFMAPLFTVQSVYFYISLCSGNYKTTGVHEPGFSLTV